MSGVCCILPVSALWKEVSAIPKSWPDGIERNGAETTVKFCSCEFRIHTLIYTKG